MDLTPLQKLARKVRETSDETASPAPMIEAAKRRALTGWAKPPRSSRRPLFVLVTTTIFVIVGFFLVTAPSAINYVVGPHLAPGVVGAWIAAGPEATELRFSEGSRMTLAPETRARVAYADQHGARVVLERGHAHTSIVHSSAKTSWNLDAGPFEIHVVGTAFDVAWDPTSEVFRLKMTEGKVLVRGPLLGEGRTLQHGEELRVEVAAKRSDVHVAPDEPVRSAPPPPAVVPDAPPPPTEQQPAQNDPPFVAPSAPIPTWRVLAAQGKHHEAMEAIEREGFNHVLDHASANVLLDLADEARFAGHYDRAEQAVLRARQRGAKGRSAFLLGKLAADHRHAPADAVTWFERYLAEAPAGGLAEQALGRLIELKRKLGDDTGARNAARRYFASYPEGSYAQLARIVAGP